MVLNRFRESMNTERNTASITKLCIFSPPARREVHTEKKLRIKFLCNANSCSTHPKKIAVKFELALQCRVIAEKVFTVKNNARAELHAMVETLSTPIKEDHDTKIYTWRLSI